MIELNDVRFQYPNADAAFYFEKELIDSGSKTAIIGPSGFGKTTLLNLIAGILVPESGSIAINGNEISKFNDKERRNYRISNIGFVFQDFRLIPYLNILDNILLPYRLNNSLKFDATLNKKAEDLANKMGIVGKLKKYASQLSHGERQRVAICRALINDPEIILADEPTGNLDPQNKRKIIDILFDYVEENKSTLITVTHDTDMLKGFNQIIDFSTKFKY
jgi:putative ABC transport system ATP-binding protein